jgi:peptidase inhibitor family I36
MKRTQIIGSLVLALGLLSGPALASGGGIEPVPTDKELDPIVNKEAEVFPATLDLAFQDARPESQEKPDEGFLPELPILLDGKLYSAEELQKAEVHLSHYVLDSRSAELDVVQGFRTSEDFKLYLEKTGQMPSEQPKDARLFCPPAHYWEHGFFGGARFSVWPGQALSNLGGFWNDRISSVWNSPCSSWTVLFEHSNFGGHQLWLGRGWAIPHVGLFGWLGWSGWFPRWYNWNDRASSVIVFW